MTAPEIWHGAARVLAGQPHTCQNIIDNHVPDGHGRCRACTIPGRGVPMAQWPCGVQQLAVLACSIAERRAS